MPRPLVIIAAVHLSGLILGATFPALGGWTSIAAAVICLAPAGGAIRRRELDPGSRWLFGAVLALGVWQGARVESEWNRSRDALATLGEGSVVHVRGPLAGEPQVSRGGTGLIIQPACVTTRAGAEVRPELAVEVNLPTRVAGEIAIADLAVGDEIVAEGFLSARPPVRNPGGFDRQAWNWQRGVAGSVVVTVSSAVQVTPGEPSWIARWLRATRYARTRLGETLVRQQGPEAGAFAQAVLLGERSAIDASDRHAFLLTGLGHLFAVSGLHTAMIYGLLLGGFRLMRLPWRLCLALALVALVPYAALVGFRVPVIRAAILVGALGAGRLMGRTVDAFSALALAALAICIADPRAPWQPGFQMSFLAVLSLVLYAAAVRDLGPRLTAPAILLAALNLALLPLMARHYGLISWVAIPMNLALVPLAFVILFGSAAGLLLVPLSPWAGDLVSWGTGQITEAMFALVRTVASWPGAAQTVSPMPVWLMGVWYALLFGGAAVLRARGPDELLRRRARWAVAWAGLLALALWLPLTDWQTQRLRVTFLDVGQGDATLVEMPSGAVVLIDGGQRRFGDRGRTVVEPALRARGIEEIDLMLATHVDGDHIGGLIHLAERFRVLIVAEGDEHGTTEDYAAFRSVVAASDAERLLVSRGTRFGGEDTSITVLHPDPDRARRGPNPNDNSVATLIAMGDAQILVMGDAEFDEERTILAHFPDLDTDIVRTGHHGSRNAAGEAFLDAVTPALAIVSCGRRNPHGHPHPDHLARLEAAGARTLRTDQVGAIEVETDGRTIWVRTGVD